MRGVADHEWRSKFINLRGLSRFLEGRCFAPLTIEQKNESGRRFAYSRISQKPLLKLFILKLDGSVFDVHVSASGTVGDLKLAIEEAFSSSFQEGHDKILWSLVWGHFCLSYRGQLLIDDKAYIRALGINDCDQLQFIRHMSINYIPMKKPMKSSGVACKGDFLMSSKSNEDNQVEGSDDTDILETQDKKSNDHIDLDGDEVPSSGFKIAHFFSGWFSYSRLGDFSQNGYEKRGRRLSRLYLQWLRGENRALRLQCH